MKIFLRHDCLAEYPLPADGVPRQQRFSPPDQPPPRYQPNNIRRRDARQEEQALRVIAREVADYLDFALKAPGIQRHRFTRGLFAFSRKLPHDILAKTLAALRYRIVDLATVECIAWLCLSQAEDVLPEADVDEDFQQRPAYQAGCLTDPPDLSVYDQPFDQQENDEQSENDNQEDDQQDRQAGD